MSDTTLLRIAIAIAGLILIGAIVFFGRPRKQGQGRRVPRESIADAFAPRTEPAFGDAAGAGDADDNYDERASQAELALDAEGPAAGAPGGDLGKRTEETFEKIVTLYLAARAQHVDQVIRPALAGGSTVVCDRYLDTSVAYQGGGRELGVDTVLELNLLAVDGLVPDRTFLVEIDVETALARVGDKRDRIEQAEAEFWPRVVDAYRDLAERFPERYVVVDGRRPVEDVAEEIRERLR